MSTAKKILFSLFTTTFFYAALEIIFYVLVCFNVKPNITQFESISKQNIVYDKIRGFKFLPGKARTVLINNNEIEFDVNFSINNVGIPSKKDYFFKKDKNTFRYIVFGDSFTQGYFLEKNWPDFLNKELDSKKIEFYNFAVDAGGLMNWHNIYFNEIINNYEYDGIIIASFGNNFDRNFWVMHPNYQSNTIKAGYLKNIPKNIEDLETNYSIQSYPGLYKPVSETDSILNYMESRIFQLQPLHFYFYKFIRAKINNAKNVLFVKKEINNFRKKFVKNIDIESYEIQDFKTRYGENKFKLLDQILTHAKENRKEVILANVPDKLAIIDGVSDCIVDFLNNNPTNILVSEMYFLSKYYDTKYFNGYEIFDNMPIDSLNNYWFAYDGHWNQKGSNLFAKKIQKIILKN